LLKTREGCDLDLCSFFYKRDNYFIKRYSVNKSLILGDKLFKKTFIAVSLISALALSACGSTSSTMGMSDSSISSVPATGDMMVENKVSIDRSIIKTSSITIRVKNVEKSITQALDLATQFEGRVDDSSQYKNPGSEDSLSANLTIRVPSANLEKALEAFKGLGDVESSSISATDVTMQKVDLDARIAALNTSIERFKQLISSATNTSDLIAAETALAERQAELDSLTAQLKYLSEQVDMSVIYLALLPNDSFSAIKPIGFLAGIEKGFVALLNAAANLTSILGYFIPWIVAILVIVAIFKLISRIRRNR
jgi:uncharacterized coiled-coil protein SlyX